MSNLELEYVNSMPEISTKNIVDELILMLIKKYGNNPLLDVTDENGNHIYITSIDDINTEIVGNHLHFKVIFSEGSLYEINYNSFKYKNKLTFVEGDIKLVREDDKLVPPLPPFLPNKVEIVITDFGVKPLMGAKIIMEVLSKELTEKLNKWLKEWTNKSPFIDK